MFAMSVTLSDSTGLIKKKIRRYGLTFLKVFPGKQHFVFELFTYSLFVYLYMNLQSIKRTFCVEPVSYCFICLTSFLSVKFD